MVLLELCLLALLSPQEPTSPAGRETPATAGPATTTDAVADAAALAAAEASTGPLDTSLLVRLAMTAESATAARATWVLANGKTPVAFDELQRVAATSPHAEARVQALQGLHRHQDFSSTKVAIAALDDGDRRVRTLAAQLLAKLRRPNAIDALLALLDKSRTNTEAGPATDVQAALLALHDLGAADQLLRAATAIHDGKVTGTGEALAFCLQGLEPKLLPESRRNLLLAILDHREPLVRRYAIDRLADLGDTDALAALEGRLAKEGDELRPLVEVALAWIRRDRAPEPEDGMQRAMHNMGGLSQKAVAFWNGRSLPEQIGIGALPVLLLFGLIRLFRRRIGVQRDGRLTAAALVQPSAEYAEQLAAAADEQAAIDADTGETSAHETTEDESELTTSGGYRR
jgi:HEAT repeat protein